MAYRPIDPLAIAYFGKEFEIAFRSKKMTEFEDWFVDLMGLAYGEDFEPVRAYGKDGDFKCDGRHVPLGRIHQCYGPEAIKARETIDKIDRDFHGAREHWAGFMKIWCFVFNDVGLPPTVTEHLDCLRAAHPDIQIVTWGKAALRNIMMDMELEQLTLAFGPPLTLSVLDSIQFEDLGPVVEALAQAEPDPTDVPTDAPSADKLEHNSLSDSVAAFLRIGRRKAVIYHSFLLIGAMVLTVVFTVQDFTNWVQLSFLIVIILFIKNIKAVSDRPLKELDPYLKQMALSTLLFSILFSLGYGLASIF